MLSRRTLLQNAALAAAASRLSQPILAQANSAPANGEDRDVLHSVDQRIGTGGHGHTFPGASVPFGAVQLSPDTYNDGWDWCSGYHISDSSIMGFSHTHLSGTGCGDLLDFLVMPGIGPVKLVPGPRSNPEQGYRSRFSHASEVMEPGYYSVQLETPGIRAEMTTTERTGLHRYTFPASESAWIILDLAHSYLTNGASSVYTAQLEQTAPDTLAGGHVTSAWGHDRHSYFTMQLSKMPTRVEFYSDDRPVPINGKLEGDNLKAVLHFDTHAGEVIYVRTGISGVSADGAGNNLRAEQPDWNFDHTRRAARDKWLQQIGRVQASFSTDRQRRIFYTALYHLTLGPQTFDDADGRYRGMDQQIHTLAKGTRNYTCFSLWDTFRAAHPAYTLIARERVADFANTLIRMAEQSPAGMAVWPLQGTETGTMTGYHSASVIAEAIRKGIPGIDVEAALRVMNRRALIENYEGLGYYRETGFIPADREPESVSKAFEYCYADWAVSTVAQHLGHTDEAAMLRQRSENYKHFFHAQTKFMQPRLANGQWALPFNPIALGHSKKWRDYTESNAWQTSFGIQHDPAGLIALYGGARPFLERLDLLFTVPSTLPPDAPPDIAGMVGQYAHGNEPSHHIGYLYVYAGAAYKTQSRVRSLMDTQYRDLPDGIAGNEDVGQMSAWYVLSALGFYPVDPVGTVYVLGSPLIEHATVDLGNGKQLRVDVKRMRASDAFIKGFTLNGEPQQRAWFRHDEIAGGAHIELEMSGEPNRDFGSDAAHLPPSMPA
jgi:predicted alpha-1,2-mannosidase